MELRLSFSMRGLRLLNEELREGQLLLERFRLLAAQPRPQAAPNNSLVAAAFWQRWRIY
jgi:hypothetical protein